MDSFPTNSRMAREVVFVVISVNLVKDSYRVLCREWWWLVLSAIHFQLKASILSSSALCSNHASLSHPYPSFISVGAAREGASLSWSVKYIFHSLSCYVHAIYIYIYIYISMYPYLYFYNINATNACFTLSSLLF